MARQIVKESFYIYCNRFKQYSLFGLIFFIIYLLHSHFNFPSFTITPLLMITAEIPCYAVFYNKNPIQCILQNIKTLLFFIMCYTALTFLMQYISNSIVAVMNIGGEKIITNLFFSIISTILHVSVTFLLTYSIKKDCGIKEAFTAYADVFSENKAWNIGLYIKISFVELGFFLILLVILFIISPILSSVEIFAVLAGTLLPALFIALIFPYLCISMCNYCEAVF